MAEATLYSEGGGEVEIVTTNALVAGQVTQLPDGRAGVAAGLGGIDAADKGALYVEGIFTFAKTASICLLHGGKAYWDRSANKVHFRPQSGDFFLGTIVGDAAAADTTCRVNINREPSYQIETEKGQWTAGAVNGLGCVRNAAGAGYVLAFDAVAEAAMAALLSVDTVPVVDGPIFEGRFTVVDDADTADKLDINIGLANAGHDTDFDSVTESVVFHIDGEVLNLLAESDDGTTEVAATDTTKDIVLSTYDEVWIDCRDPADIQLYVNGVNVLPATVFVLTDATGPLLAIIHAEKTSDDTTANLILDWMRVRCSDEG